MSRSKKSRKAGRLNPVKADKALETAEREARSRKQSGNKSGTRQLVARKVKDSAEAVDNKDPRIGSKKLIDLGVATKPVKEVKKSTKDNRPSVAAIKVVDDTPVWEAELLAIESDMELQQLADKVESGEDVSEEEAKHLETSLARYQFLIEKLNLATEDDSAENSEEEIVTDLDEDALWGRLDTTDFSEFKE